MQLVGCGFAVPNDNAEFSNQRYIQRSLILPLRLFSIALL